MSDSEALFNASSINFPYGSRPVYHINQSSSFSFTDWISLLTLCFAPLIAHILSGVPTPIYLHPKPPSWHDRLVLYNPTTIIWRYLSIADRRARSLDWNTTDLAIANAVFWTPKGWDGTEETGEKSKALLTRKPSATKSWLCASNVATAIVTIQGVEAVYFIVISIFAEEFWDVDFYALSTVFLWLAALGLLRLPAAWWITDDYAFEENLNGREDVGVSNPSPSSLPSVSATLLPRHRPSVQRWKSLASFDAQFEAGVVPSKRRSAGCWHSVAVRLGMTAFICAFAVPASYGITPVARPRENSASDPICLTQLLQLYMYALLSVPATFVLAVYSVKGEKSTILPCAQKIWFKVYTLFWYAWALVTIVVAALGTARTPCARYTAVWVSKSVWEQGCPLDR